MLALVECEMPFDRGLPLTSEFVSETLFWAEAIAPAVGITSGVTSNAAPADDAVPGARPHAIIHVFSPTGLYIAIGTTPDATNPAARRWLRGGETHRLVLPNGHKVAWALN